jgi:hypothetical protein
MKRSRLLLSLVALAPLTLGGCVVGAIDDEPGEEASIGEAEQAVKIIPPGGDNGKRGLRLWRPGTLSAYQLMASKAITNFPLFDSNQLPPDLRQEVLENVIECALPQQASVVDPFDGHVYQGWWGLAPQWLNGPLDAAGRRFVTACMIQRLNAFGATVPILLEGAHPAIQYNATLDPLLPFDESTAWGDIFAKTFGPPPVYVCWDQDLENVCPRTSPTPPSWWLDMRICDSSPTCGLKLMGPCKQACTYDANGYATCKNPNGTTTSETVHVQLLPRNTCAP